MRGVLAAYGINDRTVWVADSFEGLPPPTCAQDDGIDLTQRQFPCLVCRDSTEVRNYFHDMTCLIIKYDS